VLEERSLLGVELDAANQRRREAVEEADDALVVVLGIDPDGGEVAADLISQDALDQPQIVIDERRGLGGVGALLDLAPQIQQEAQVGAELFFGCALGGGADDESAGGLAALVDENALEALALLVGGDLAADADVGDGGHEDQEAAGQRDVRGDARALLGDGLLGDLDENLLSGLSRSLMMGRSEVCAERRDIPRPLPACAAALPGLRVRDDRGQERSGRCWDGAPAAAGASSSSSSKPSSSPPFSSKFNWMR
jgi:hypothetical protein